MALSIPANEGRKLLLQVLQATPKGRRRLADASLAWKVNYYLDKHVYPHQDRWANLLSKTRRGGIIAPTGHGKSELASFWLPIDEITKNRNIRILMLSETDDLATKAGGRIRLELETNPRLIGDYGTFNSRRSVWTDQRFQVIRAGNPREATFEAAGMGSAITGGRFDLIICDDIISSLSVRNPDVRKFHLDYLNDTVLQRLEPGARFWFVGTRKHRFDIYDWLIANPQFRVIVDKALIREPEQFDFIELDEPELDEDGHEVLYKVAIGLGDQGEALWPKQWSVAKLLLDRKSNRAAFNREKQGEVTDDENAIIHWEWLENCCDKNRSYGKFNREDYIGIITGVDPALAIDKKLAEAHNTDYAVFFTLGIKPNHHFELIGLKRVRGLSPSELKGTYVEQARLFEPNLMFNEINSFGTIYQWEVKKDTGIPIVAHRTDGRNKHNPLEGVPSLAALIENRQITFPYCDEDDKRRTDSLIQELYNTEEGAGKDDQRMACWITVSGCRRYLKQLDYLKKKGRRTNANSD